MYIFTYIYIYVYKHTHTYICASKSPVAHHRPESHLPCRLTMLGSLPCILQLEHIQNMFKYTYICEFIYIYICMYVIHILIVCKCRRPVGRLRAS